MEPEENKKALTEEIVNFIAKRSEAEFPRYAARLRSYVDFGKKHHRAATAQRRHAEGREKKVPGKKDDQVQKDKPGESIDRTGEDDRGSRKRGGEKCAHRSRSFSRSVSRAPSDACGRRRRRRKCRRRRKSRCRRRRRRRSCRRRRRRSCSRRRRRRSCRRRRRRCRRRRRRCC